MHRIIAQFGVNNVIVTDQGNESDGKLANALFKALQVHRIRTSPYNPRANSEIERRWEMIWSYMAKHTVGLKSTEDLLELELGDVNNIPNNKPMYTPNYLMYY